MEAAGCDPARLDRLVRAARRHVRLAGLPAAQLAVARHGRLKRVWSYGCEADRMFVVMSVTKALTAAAFWLLLEAGGLGLGQPVADWIPGFAAHGKGAVRVEHLLTHTAGFPDAHLAPLDGADPVRRLERFQSWRVQFPPGSRFQHHPTATMWVLAELIERASGEDFRAFVRTRLLTPLGLRDLHLGLPPELGPRVAPLSFVGRALPRGLLRLLGLRIPAFVEDEPYYLSYNQPAVRAVGVPSSGAVATAGALALFLQALLDGGQSLAGRRLWSPETLRAALRVRTGSLRDPITGRRALRCLGLVRAGGGGRTARGFGRGCGPEAFGHPGMGGQVAWADPAAGISFVFLTSGFDRNLLRLGLRNLVLSNLAAACGG